jgi:hypothetical protein
MEMDFCIVFCGDSLVATSGEGPESTVKRYTKRKLAANYVTPIY